MSGAAETGITDIAYISKADSSKQHMLFYDSGSGKKKPLLVGLHTWSNSYINDTSSIEYLCWCKENDWALAFPDFRGPNVSPEAMGSEKAVSDIVAAVAHAKTLCVVDDTRIYLAGVSGGGHMALLMAALHEEIWAGVTAWVPIFDLEDWWRQCTANAKYKRYADMIETCAEGAPTPQTKAFESCRKRSASSCPSAPAPFMLDINGGLFDGRDGSVPFTHSLKAFNAAADVKDRIPEADITEFYETQKSPSSDGCTDELYGGNQPVFRKISGNVRVTIFNGGHGCVYGAALNLLAIQQKGTPAVWPIAKETLATDFHNAGH